MADRRTFEEIVAEIGDIPEAAHLAAELNRDYGKSTLREDAGRAAKLEAELAQANAKINTLEKAPLRDQAFREYGVDFGNLRRAELAAIERYEGEIDKEAIAAFVEEFELPVLVGQQVAGESPPPAAGMVAVATGPPAAGVRASGEITPDTVRSWNENGPEKWMRFKDEHPEAAEQILQGKTVTGVTFS